MIKVLTSEKLLEPMKNRKRVHQACDAAPFLAAVEELKKGAGIKAGKKPAEKSKTPTRASAKTAKTPRKKK
jgi:hypothetical protein